MNPIATHWIIRLRAVLAEPVALAVLLASGLASLVFWPTNADMAGGAEVFGAGSGGFDSAELVLLWAYSWTLLAAMLIPGTATGGSQGWGYAQRAMPSLPIGSRSRIAAEVLVVFSFVAVFRLPFIILGDAAQAATGLPLLHDGAVEPGRFAAQTVMGAFLMLPCLTAWLMPASTIHVWFLKPLLVAAAMYGLHAAGVMAGPWTTAACCLALAGLVLAAGSRRIPLPAPARRPAAARAEVRFRPGIDPQARLRRDQWLRPLPAAALLVAAEILLLICEHTIGLPGYGFYLGSTAVFSFMLSLVLMRPIGSFLIAGALRGHTNIRLGDFASAWSVLPVRPIAVMRGVYAHGLITGSGIWLFILGTNLLHTYVETGEAYLADLENRPGAKLLLFAIAAVPCLAGALTCAAVGDRGRGFLSLAAAGGVLFGHFACLIAKPGAAVHVALLIFLALLGGVPPLVHLRTRRAGVLAA